MHPILFEIRQTPVYTYGLLMALAMTAVLALSVWRARAHGFSPAVISDLVFVLFVAGVVGARLFYILQHFEAYRTDPVRIFSFREGGLVWYGGFILAAISGMVYAFRHGLPVLKLCDFFAPLVPLGHAIGRLGCFLNGCCYGRVSHVPWAVTFPGDSSPRHPTQIYEALSLAALSLLLFGLSARRHRTGEIFAFYLLFYALIRIGTEYFRGDQYAIGPLTIPQWTSLFLLAGAAALLAVIRRRQSFNGR